MHDLRRSPSINRRSAAEQVLSFESIIQNSQETSIRFVYKFPISRFVTKRETKTLYVFESTNYLALEIRISQHLIAAKD